jgi:hypothetical protein
MADIVRTEVAFSFMDPEEKLAIGQDSSSLHSIAFG